VQRAVGVFVTPIGSDDRFILVLRETRAGAVLRLAPAHRLDGLLIDPANGRPIEEEECIVPPGGTCDIAVPEGFPILLLAMR
jgi:hypothetical protein